MGLLLTELDHVPHIGREMLGSDIAALALDPGELEGVLELAHVSGPRVGHEQGHHIGGERNLSSVRACGLPVDEKLREERDVVDPLPERRHQNRNDTEPVVEILPEPARGDLRLEVLVGGADDPHVHLEGLFTADAFEGTFLEDPEELDLHRHAEIGHLVEEDRPPVRELEPALAIPDRSGEGALDVAEELALEEAIRKGAAVDGNEVALRPSALIVNRFRHQLLSGATLAEDHNRNVGVGNLPNGVEDLVHRRGVAHDPRETFLGAQQTAQAVELGDVLEDDDGQPLALVVEGHGADEQDDVVLLTLSAVRKITVLAVDCRTRKRVGDRRAQLAPHALLQRAAAVRVFDGMRAREQVPRALVDGGHLCDLEGPLQTLVDHADATILIDDHDRGRDGVEEGVHEPFLLGQLLV